MAFCFDYEELEAYRVIRPRNAPRSEAFSSLTINIHPLFQFNRWDCRNEGSYIHSLEKHGDINKAYEDRVPIPDELYERLKPALQLASVFLDKSIAFTSRIYTGSKNQGSNGFGTPLLEETVNADPLMNNGRNRVSETNQALIRLSQKFPILVGSSPNWRDTYPDSYAVTTCVPCPELPKIGYFTYLLLNPKWWQLFIDKDWEEWKKAEPEHLHRIMFQLAATLVHETMHALANLREIEERESNGTAQETAPPRETHALTNGEGVWEDDGYIEYGFEWEHWMFGGRIQSIEYGAGIVESECGLCWQPISSPRQALWHRADSEAEPHHFAISTESISAFFKIGRRAPAIQLVPCRAMVNEVDAGDYPSQDFRMKQLVLEHGLTWENVRECDEWLKKNGVDDINGRVSTALLRKVFEKPDKATLNAYRRWRETVSDDYPVYNPIASYDRFLG